MRRAHIRILTSRKSLRSRTTVTSTAAISIAQAGLSGRRLGRHHPPYPYVDENGVLRTFPGSNWSDEGQAIYGNGCDLPAPPEPEPLTPVLKCVEAADDGFLAHFGYANPNATTIQPPESQNYFSPGATNRGQPTSFGPGTHSDIFQVRWDGSDLTWNLTGRSVAASSESDHCTGGSLTVNKHLLPANDQGRFNLKMDGNIEGERSEVGDGGTTGTIAVPSGKHTVSESASPGTSLMDYRIQIVCRGGGGDGDVVAQGNGASLDVKVSKGAAIICTITNEARENAGDVSPLLSCVVFDGNTPVVADWGSRTSQAYRW